MCRWISVHTTCSCGQATWLPSVNMSTRSSCVQRSRIRWCVLIQCWTFCTSCSVTTIQTCKDHSNKKCWVSWCLLTITTALTVSMMLTTARTQCHPLPCVQPKKLHSLSITKRWVSLTQLWEVFIFLNVSRFKITSFVFPYLSETVTGSGNLKNPI